MIFPYTIMNERNFNVNPLQLICQKIHLSLEPTDSISVKSKCVQ